MLEWDELIYILGNYRLLNSDEIVTHITKYYNVNEETVRNDKRLMSKIYEHDFETRYINLPETSYGREDFDKVRRKYVKFSDTYYDMCEISEFMPKEDVHHIYPIVYGGSNHYKNLIYINGFLHSLLHENPREEYENCCHLAIDHLCMLTHNQFELVTSLQDANNDHFMASKLYKQRIKTKMWEFYSFLNALPKSDIGEPSQYISI